MCQHCKWEDARDNAGSLLADLGDLPERAEDFVGSATERVTGMLDWIEEHQHVTDKMLGALENIEGAVSRWREPR